MTHGWNLRPWSTKHICTFIALRMVCTEYMYLLNVQYLHPEDGYNIKRSNLKPHSVLRTCSSRWPWLLPKVLIVLAMLYRAGFKQPLCFYTSIYCKIIYLFFCRVTTCSLPQLWHPVCCQHTRNIADYRKGEIPFSVPHLHSSEHLFHQSQQTFV